VSHVAHRESVVGVPTLASREELANVLANLHAAVTAYETARAEYEMRMQALRDVGREEEAVAILAELERRLAARRAQS
jgi:hypothetical protein